MVKSETRISAKEMLKMTQGTITLPQPSYTWNNSKVLVVSIMLGLIFLLVSFPKSYGITNNIFGNVGNNNLAVAFPIKLPINIILI